MKKNNKVMHKYVKVCELQRLVGLLLAQGAMGQVLDPKEIGEMQKDAEQNQCPVHGKQLETEVKWLQQILI